MRLQQNTLFAALVTIFLLSNTTQAIAKTSATAHKQYGVAVENGKYSTLRKIAFL